jgi:hypothetical protein
LRLILHYSFEELNLYRLGALLGEDNPGGLRFLPEVRLCGRGARGGRRCSVMGAAGICCTWVCWRTNGARTGSGGGIMSVSVQGDQVLLTAEDPEVWTKNDARWVQDSEFYRLFDTEPRCSRRRNAKSGPKDLEGDPKTINFSPLKLKRYGSGDRFYRLLTCTGTTATPGCDCH